MKKYFLLLILLIPFVVRADESCNPDNITIESITIEDKTGRAEEIEEATASGRNINFNLSMSEVGDSIDYEIVVKNNSDEDYELDETDLLPASDYIDYTITSDDNSNIVNANSSKNVNIKVEYKNAVPNETFTLGVYNDNKTMTINLSTLSSKDSTNALDSIINPNTGNYFFIIFLSVLIISGITIVLLKKHKYTKAILLIICSTIIIPLTIYALCKCEITLQSNITIYPSSLSVVDCDNNISYTTIPSNLEGLANIMAQNAYLDNGKSEYVTSCNGVDFSKISSDTNGKGVYEIASTKDDTYPIYYYRGAVDNNNVIFAGFCWKAIRTTSTGGVKLIYNGMPDRNGYCNNTTGDDTQIGTSSFNTTYNSPAYQGYMYGTVYDVKGRNINSAYVYGNSVEYSNGKYTLIDTKTGSGTWGNDYNTLDNYHYTCFSTGTTCSSVNYIFSTYYALGAYYITLSNGQTIEDALDDMFSNTTDSNIKIEIDNWYRNNLWPVRNYIEDTEYCNDRSISSLGGWNPNGGSTTDNYLLKFGISNRQLESKPSLQCNRNIDKFTVSNTLGNGKLTYPIGLITADEVTYAGAKSPNFNNSYYLHTNKGYWTSTPSNFESGDIYGWIYNPYSLYVGPTGSLASSNVSNLQGVRPVISLKPNTIVESGEGTNTNPYIIFIAA